MHRRSHTATCMFGLTDCAYSESMLEKYPDLEVRVPKLLAPDVKTLVVDCEAVAWDIEQHRILPFQASSAVHDSSMGDICTGRTACHLSLLAPTSL